MTTNHSRHTTAAADGPGTRYPVRPDGPATPPRRRRAVVGSAQPSRMQNSLPSGSASSSPC